MPTIPPTTPARILTVRTRPPLEFQAGSYQEGSDAADNLSLEAPFAGCRMRRSAEFLEFAQAAGGFGVFDLDLVTGGISGTPLFFDLIGLAHGDETLTREEWVATIHPEDLEAVVVELGAAIDSRIPYQSEYRTLTLTAP